MYGDWTKIMTQKFTKNISYMIHPTSPEDFIDMCRLQHSYKQN